MLKAHIASFYLFTIKLKNMFLDEEVAPQGEELEPAAAEAPVGSVAEEAV